MRTQARTMVEPRFHDFKYHVGIRSLAQVATREDRVCVLNILGGESRDVTPVSHAYSGGNVVFGTSPGRGGQVLPTPAGDIPVFDNVLEGLAAGHRFDCGVVYLPPAAARDGVAELLRVNPELKKIFIITEKIAVHDAREIRAMAQHRGVDVFGANGLGVADAWQQVRIGGALGGDDPQRALRAGSIAIFSNSGGFTTTIAQYLRMAGWGTTTLISSGKDVYIHFAAPEFAFALANDARTKAAVLYCEPGGFYEADAVFTKPVVACVVGRWKSRLTRAVGHAGALAGGNDDAAAKERWFLEKFGVDAPFTPTEPVFSARGALVTNIAHIPAALTAVMRANAALPDFDPEGNLDLKPWFGSDAGHALPANLALPVVRAVAPYDQDIARSNRQVGYSLPRQSMKDASGASQMDPLTQVSSLHGVTVLEAAGQSIEANMCLALLHDRGTVNDHRLIAAAVAAHCPLHGRIELAAAQAARDAGNAPNAVLLAAVSLVGPGRQVAARQAVSLMIDRFLDAGLADPIDAAFETATVSIDGCEILVASEPEERAEALLTGLASRGADSAILRWLRQLPGHPSFDAVLAAVATTLAWLPLRRKRISRLTAESLPWWLQLLGTMIGASAPASAHSADRFCGLSSSELLGRASLSEACFSALFGAPANERDHLALQTLFGLLLTNGPGAISAQGAKGAVSSDGPETPVRVQLNTAMGGFLTHTGYTHGGNGHEGIRFLLDEFHDVPLADPSERHPGVDVDGLARRFVERYAERKAEAKAAGESLKIPGIHHPVFKDKPVNRDPREAFVAEQFAQRGEFNVFHAFYRAVAQSLYDAGVTRNIYCVNVDAVIASLLLGMLWQPLRDGQLAERDLEHAAFAVFLLPRMLGCAAEIDDHMNRGRDMDTRTPATRCRHVV
jgi:succinyl-CoA synthetase alpha subunit